MTAAEAEPKLVAFANAFLPAYTEAIDENWSQVRDEAQQLDALHDLFPLYGRALSEDVAIAACRGGLFFYIYWVRRRGVAIEGWADKEEFDKAWLDRTSEDTQQAQIREALGLSHQEILHRDEPGSSRYILNGDLESYTQRGAELGSRTGNLHGKYSEWRWPTLQKKRLRSEEAAAMTRRYRNLLDWDGRPQKRGQEFERLWRDCLNFHGWHAHKIRISGEDNDFTAIYNGLHIVGEVKWHVEPMTGNDVREFLAKLDPRPQSIGMYVSHSGIDAGAKSVIRRAVNSKTVLLFARDDIEKVLLEQAEPGSLFDEKLREAYDKLFE